MPFRTEWVDPDTFLEHNGVTVYYTYKDDDVEQGLAYYGYTVYRYASLVDDLDFDVRDLKAFSPDMSHEDVLRAAIESGELLNPDARE